MRPSRSASGSRRASRSSSRDPIMRPSMLSVTTINLFNFASAALFILYVDLRSSACRRARSAWLSASAPSAA